MATIPRVPARALKAAEEHLAQGCIRPGCFVGFGQLRYAYLIATMAALENIINQQAACIKALREAARNG
jgi:hypothetical protein